MSGFFTIFKKDIIGVFKDKRILINILIPLFLFPLSSLLDTLPLGEMEMLSENMPSPEDMKQYMGTSFSMLLPTLMIMFIFSSASCISVETFAGEKENGTLEQLLVTQIGRKSILCGKIFVVFVIAIFSAICTLTGGYITSHIMGFTLINSLSVLLLLIITAIMYALLTSLVLSYISITASCYRDGHTSSGILTLIMSLSGIIFSFLPISTDSVLPLFIPFHNLTITIESLLSNSLHISKFLFAIVVSLLYSAIMFYICDNALKNEKYILSKN